MILQRVNGMTGSPQTNRRTIRFRVIFRGPDTGVLVKALRHALFPLMALAIGSGAVAQTVPAPVRAAAERITAADVGRDLNYFASDALMGRNTFSAGFDSASSYIIRRLERAGLRPAGDNGTFRQHYTVRELIADTAAARLEVGGRRFTWGTDWFLRAYPRQLSGTFQTVDAGHGWVIPDHNIDPYQNLDVRGKVVISTGPRGFPAGVTVRQIGRTFGTALSSWEAAARRGAAALIIVIPEESLGTWARLPRSAGGFEMEPRIPSAYAAIPLPVLIVGPQVAAAIQQSGRVRLSLPPAINRTHRGHNVVAILEGSDPVLRNEYLTLESHLDGAVGTNVIDGDSIYNSADDNASGSAGNLAIAEQLARGPRPKRSLIFIWDSGEERGLWGTRYFVEHPPVPLDRIVTHVNIDMIGANRAPGSADANEQRATESDEIFLIGPGVLSDDADSVLVQTNREYGNLRFNRAYDREDHEFFYPRTDAGPFLERGVITIGYTTGIHPRYHRPADEARYLDPIKIERISRSILVGVWMMADMPQRPRLDGIPALVPRYGQAVP